MPRILVERIDSPLQVNLRSRHHLAPSLSSRPPAVAVSKDRPVYAENATSEELEAPTGREEEIYVCKSCKAHLCSSRDIVSQHFHGKHGKAFLTRRCANSYFGPAEQKMLMTGLHIVRNVYCGGAGGNVVTLSDRADVMVEEMQLQQQARQQKNESDNEFDDEEDDEPEIRDAADNDDCVDIAIATNAAPGRHLESVSQSPAPPIAQSRPYTNNPQRKRRGDSLDVDGAASSSEALSNTSVGSSCLKVIGSVPAAPCGRLLGWTYDYAHERQQLYKMAKYVIEHEHVESMW